MSQTFPITSRRARTLTGGVVAALASTALVGGLLAGPAGAQEGPSATAVAFCEDGVGGIAINISDPSESYLLDIFLDDELVAEEEPAGTSAIGGLENGTYEVGIDGVTDGPTIDVLTTDVVVDCAAEPTTTTTAPPSPSTTAAPSTTAPAPAAANRSAARGLSFTG